MEALLDDGDQHINRHRYPDLGFDGILRCAVETFDPKILFDPFEQLGDILPINTILPR